MKIQIKKGYFLITLFPVLLTHSLDQNYELVWSDEFEYTGLPDPGKWTFETGGDGWGNNELQYHTDRLENAEVRDSVLVITAREESYGGREYTSARIVTYNNSLYWRYGKFEARMKLPYGQSFTLASGKFADDFHVFSIEWNEQTIRWKLDGNQFNVIDISSSELSEFHGEYFVILNLAVGDNWPGAPDESTEFPQEYQIDYVRVYSLTSDLGYPAYERQLRLFPIPGDNEIFVGADQKLLNCCIIDYTGKIIDNQALTDNRIDISGLPVGIYMVRLENYNGDLIPGKLIKY